MTSGALKPGARTEMSMASSYGAVASAKDASKKGYGAAELYGQQVNQHGQSYHPDPYGKGGYVTKHGAQAGQYGAASGKGSDSMVWQGASAAKQAAAGAYDNDEWAKQAYGSDYDSRWGKSYDSVSAKSYDNESYARAVQADDDQWAEDYDRYDSRDAGAQGRGASKWGKDADKTVKGHAHPGYHGTSVTSKKGAEYDIASEAGQAGYWGKSGSDWDAYGRDQDLSIKESYDRTWAKSYDAESYDEWDNKDDDKWGAQAWGKDRDVYGASSFGKAASAGDYDMYGRSNAAAGAASASKYGSVQPVGYGKHGYGKSYSTAQAAQAASSKQGYGSHSDAQASRNHAAARSMYDNDEWAKQAYGSDFDSRYGKSYDSVQARQYDNEHYAREVRADDDQWAEDYDRYTAGHDQDYGQAASAQKHNIGKGWGLKKGGLDSKAASAQRGGDYDRKMAQDWDAYGRDQDFHEKVSYDQTRAKAYSAESYDEWDNEDADKWGAQAWGKDRDVLGASSYGKAASSGKYGQYGADYGQAYGAGKGKGLGYGIGGIGGYGKGPRNAGAEGSYAAQNSLWEGASKGYGAAKLGYDNDAFAKQAYGQDADSRYGKSYDSVSARSYDNEKYARWLQADDDQWAEDYDSYDSGMADAYGRGASVWTDTKGKLGVGYGVGLGKGKGELDAASKQGRAGTWGKSGSDWDAYGRDQDLEVDESYEATWAKSYDAESYDEWDNKDDDRWGAQAWGKDRDLYGASSEGARASEGDKDT